jgi:hypothetical protein
MMFNHLLIEQILVLRAYNPAVRGKEILGRHNKPFHSELGQRRITANWKYWRWSRNSRSGINILCHILKKGYISTKYDRWFHKAKLEHYEKEEIQCNIKHIVEFKRKQKENKNTQQMKTAQKEIYAKETIPVSRWSKVFTMIGRSSLITIVTSSSHLFLASTFVTKNYQKRSKKERT